MNELFCFTCKKQFNIKIKDYNYKKKKYGHDNFCCTRSCQVKKQQKDKKYSTVV